MNLTFPTRLLLTVISGASYWPLSAVVVFASGPHLGLTGGIFGLLVLVPFIEAESRRIARALALVVASIGIHTLSFMLAMALIARAQLPFFACGRCASSQPCTVYWVVRGVNLSQMASMNPGAMQRVPLR